MADPPLDPAVSSEVVVVTGWHPAAWLGYAERCIGSFCDLWEPSVRLLGYVEQFVPAAPARVEQRSLWDCRGVHDFIETHSQDPDHCGRGETGTRRGRYLYKGGYSFAFDAVRFCRQAFIPEAAAAGRVDGTILCWLDADVLTTAPVSAGLVAGLFGKGADVVHIGREAQASELGFWGVRLSPGTRVFLAAFAETYRSGEVFALAEWHSGFVFDHCLRQMPTLAVRNLVPKEARLQRGHVWFSTPLGKCTDHLKGQLRKVLGRSPERPTR